MAFTGPAPELRFDSPGPGFWELDPVHFPRPASRYWSAIHPPAFQRGTSEFARSYGMVIEALEMAYVNGFAYKRVKPLDPADVPERFARAEVVFAQKVWPEQLRDWNQTFKPEAIRAHRALQAIDPEALDDDALAAHLVCCRDHHAQMLYQHMRFTAAAIVPTGDFLAHVGDWTALPAAQLLGLMRGSSPVSAGASAELGALIAAYLDLVGYRLLDGFDISNPCAIELPDALRRAIRAAVAEQAVPSDLQDRISAERARVPEAHRSQFDELLEEARLTYPIRDERGVFSDIWAPGGPRPSPRSAPWPRCRPRRDGRPAGRQRRSRRRCPGRPRRLPRGPQFPGGTGQHRHPAAACMMRATGLALDALFRPASSAGSSAATSWSPARRPKPSTSCCPCWAAS